MTGITKGPWTVERQGPGCATIWAGDTCVFDAIDVAGNEANLTAMGEVPAMVEALRMAARHIRPDAMEYSKGTHGDRVYPVDVIAAILSRIDGAGDTLPDAPALTATCPHCGRDNTGHEGEPCADDCPQYWEGKGKPHPEHPTGELVTVRADHLAALVEAAGKYADDLETGLEDGTYEDRADLDAVRTALAIVQGEN